MTPPDIHPGPPGGASAPWEELQRPDFTRITHAPRSDPTSNPWVTADPLSKRWLALGVRPAAEHKGKQCG